MNWVNLTFYIACSFTGLCWLLWKTKAINHFPKWLGETTIWFGEIFWLLTIIFIIRSFVWEPFRIPSASMMPTLEDGDFILVNKYQYGMKMPGFDFKISSGVKPSRGDVAVFRYPPDPTSDFIKRIIGLPGDIIEYKSEIIQTGKSDEVQKNLFINGEKVAKTLMPAGDLQPDKKRINVYEESLLDKKHQIREFSDRFVLTTHPSSFISAMQCTYDLPTAFRCKVPEGHYFMLGDNRDESADSRYWGFVPEENIVGRAFYIWMNFGKYKRIGGIQ